MNIEEILTPQDWGFPVPISYGPQQKFLARVEQGRDYQDGVGTTLTLPRMSFEVMGMNYDATRKVSTMQTFKSVNKSTNKMVKAFMPVPYNINMQLSILAKLNEDAIQILEQIQNVFPNHKDFLWKVFHL